MVWAQLALGDGDLIGLEEARPIDVGLFEVRAADGVNWLRTIKEFLLRMLGEATGVNKDAVGEIVAVGIRNEGINLALRNELLTPKELALDGGK